MVFELRRENTQRDRKIVSKYRDLPVKEVRIIGRQFD